MTLVVLILPSQPDKKIPKVRNQDINIFFVFLYTALHIKCKADAQ